MNNRIIFSSMLVIMLLLLMPSIPAIKGKLVYDEFNDKIEIKNPDYLDSKGIKELKELLQVKYPLLYFLVIFSLNFRWSRIEFLAEYSFDEDFPYTEIKNPILFLRFLILVINTHLWSGFWEITSNILGWDWTITK